MEKVLEKNNTKTSKRFRQLYHLKTTPKPTNQNHSKQSLEKPKLSRGMEGAGAAIGAGLVVWWCSLSLLQRRLLAWLQTSVIVNWMLSDGSGHLAPCLAPSSRSTHLADWVGNWPPGYSGGYRLSAEPITALLRHSLIVKTKSNFSLLLWSPFPSQLVCSQPNTQLMTLLPSLCLPWWINTESCLNW